MFFKIYWRLLFMALILLKNFPKLSSPSQNFVQLQPPPDRCLPETPEQLKEILAWGT